MTLLRSREPEPVALDSLDEVSSGEMQDFDRASGNVSDLWDQVTPLQLQRVSWRNIGYDRICTFHFRGWHVYVETLLGCGVCKVQCAPSEAVRQRHEQVISDAGWSKLDFAERDKCKPVLSRLSLARNLEKPVLSLYGAEWRERGYGLGTSTDSLPLLTHSSIISFSNIYNALAIPLRRRVVSATYGFVSLDGKLML